MTVLRSGIAALVLLAGIAAAPSAGAGCFWNGIIWMCWTHPLFPGVAPDPFANPYRPWTNDWGGPLWRFYGWERV
jgi:hypothetical protein